MALKFKFKTKDEIPAEHLPFYAERDGGWVLDAEGAVEKTKLDEVRNTNTTLLKERDDLKKRFADVSIRVIPADKLDLESDSLEK